MIWIFLLINIIAHWKIFLLPGQLAYGDLEPFPEYAYQGFKEFFFIWKEVTFGMQRSTGYIFHIIQSSLVFIFRSPEFTQKIFIFIIPLISFITFKYLLINNVKIKNKWVIFIASLFYAYSPIFFQESIGGSLYSTVLIFAFFPILYSLVFKIIEKPSVKKIFLFSIFFGILSSIYSQLIFIFIVAFMITITIDLILNKFKSFKNWVYMLFTGIMVFFFNPYYFLDSFGLIKTTTSTGELTSFGASLDYFKSILPITYQGSSLLNTLRMGNNLAGYLLYQESYFRNLIFLIIIFIVLLTTIYYFLKVRPLNKYFIFSITSYIFFVLFMFLATKTSLINVYSKIPLMYMFRNPAKLTYIATFFFSILFAVTYEFLLKKIKNLYLKYVTLSITYIIVFIYLWPIFLGDKGLEGARDWYYIPDELKQISQLVNQDKGKSEGRSLWIPSSHEDTSIKLTWLDKNKLEAQLGMTDFGGEYHEYDLFSGIIYSLRNSDINSIQNIFKLAQIKYMPVLKETRYYDKQIINYEDINKLLSKYQKISQTDKYDIYKNENIVNDIYSPKTIISSNARSSDYFIVASLPDPNSNYGIIFSNHINKTIQDNLLYNFISPIKLDSPFSNTIVDASWKYPNVDRGINNISAYLEKLKNVQREDNFLDYLSRVSDNFVIVSQLISNSKPDETELKQLLAYYNGLLTELNNIMNNIPVEKRNTDFVTILRKPMLYLDESISNISKIIILPAEIKTNYESFKTYISGLDSGSCQGDYCFRFSTSTDQPINSKIYSKNNKIDSIQVTMNGNKISNLNNYSFNPFWIDLGNISYNKGPNEVIVSQITKADEDLDYEIGDNYIKLLQVRTPNTYEISFLYHLENIDSSLSLTENTPSQDFEVNNKKIFLAKLSKSFSNDFCTKIIENKCYRKFIYFYNPQNSSDSLYINFSETLGNGKNLLIDEVKATESDSPILGFVLDKGSNYFPPEIEYKKINPTKYKVEIKNVTDRYILVLNQSFNTNWELQIKDNIQKPILDEQNHFIINGYANAWLINPADSNNKTNYKITIEYKNQKLYYINLLLMGSYFIVGGYIVSKDYIIPYIKNKKNKKKNAR